jgi:hypothetical protein
MVTHGRPVSARGSMNGEISPSFAEVVSTAATASSASIAIARRRPPRREPEPRSIRRHGGVSPASTLRCAAREKRRGKKSSGRTNAKTEPLVRQ